MKLPGVSTLPNPAATIQSDERAEVAQLVEQLIRNQQVVGSSPTFGSTFHLHLKDGLLKRTYQRA